MSRGKWTKWKRFNSEGAWVWLLVKANAKHYRERPMPGRMVMKTLKLSRQKNKGRNGDDLITIKVTLDIAGSKSKNKVVVLSNYPELVPEAVMLDTCLFRYDPSTKKSTNVDGVESMLVPKAELARSLDDSCDAGARPESRALTIDKRQREAIEFMKTKLEKLEQKLDETAALADETAALAN